VGSHRPEVNLVEIYPPIHVEWRTNLSHALDHMPSSEMESSSRRSISALS